MTTITKERLQWLASISGRDDIDDIDGGEIRELARIALASLEADPVAYIFKHPAGKLFWALTDESNKEQSDVIPVYASPPVPVVPEEKPMPNPLKMYAVDAVAAIAEVRGWNACRAAMLQAEPVSNSDELPLDYLQGHKDGLEWAAQLAEANHPQTGDWLYDDPIDLARAIRKGPDMPTVQAGNYPVTPDGWISCSERMPEMGERQCYVLAADFKNNYPPNIPNTQVGVYGDWFNDGNPTWDDGDGEDLYLKEVTHWMPLPEPPRLKEL
ncbi:DUF551 domain-containing protein [Escherichia coli]